MLNMGADTGTACLPVGANALRIMTWNVNGLRPMLNRRVCGLSKVLKDLQADILCIQETKLSRSDMESLHNVGIAEGWSSYFSFCTYRSGYAGVVTFCKNSTATPLAAEDGLCGTAAPQNSRMTGTAERVHFSASDPFWNRYTRDQLEMIDSQGRCVITDHGAFVLFNIYGPAVTNELSERFAFKMRFYQVLKHRMEAMLQAGRSVVLAGDLNIAPYPIDHCDYVRASRAQQESMLLGRPDRAWFRNALQSAEGPFVDLFRKFHSNRLKSYTVWNMKTNARPRNHGSRVDFILAASGCCSSADKDEDNAPLEGRFSDCRIWFDLEGSDHAPVWADLQLPGGLPQGARPPALDVRNRQSTGGQRQEQLTNIFSRHALATKRKSPAIEAEPRQPSVKIDKRQRTHEDTPEREGLDDLFA